MKSHVRRRLLADALSQERHRRWPPWNRIEEFTFFVRFGGGVRFGRTPDKDPLATWFDLGPVWDAIKLEEGCYGKPLIRDLEMVSIMNRIRIASGGMLWRAVGLLRPWCQIYRSRHLRDADDQGFLGQFADVQWDMARPRTRVEYGLVGRFTDRFKAPMGNSPHGDDAEGRGRL